MMSTKHTKTDEHSLIDPREGPDQIYSSVTPQEEEGDSTAAEPPTSVIPTCHPKEVETCTYSIVVKLSPDPKAAPVVSSNPAFFLSAALWFMTVFVMIFGASLEGHLRNVQPPSFKKPTADAFAHFQPIVDTVDSQPTIDSLFSMTWQ